MHPLIVHCLTSVFSDPYLVSLADLLCILVPVKGKSWRNASPPILISKRHSVEPGSNAAKEATHIHIGRWQTWPFIMRLKLMERASKVLFSS